MTAFHRTKPIVNCEMGILRVKDSVRLVNGRKLKDKDGCPYARGKGTVMTIEGDFCSVMWKYGGLSHHPVNAIFKTGR